MMTDGVTICQFWAALTAQVDRSDRYKAAHSTADANGRRLAAERIRPANGLRILSTVIHSACQHSRASSSEDPAPSPDPVLQHLAGAAPAIAGTFSSRWVADLRRGATERTLLTLALECGDPAVVATAIEARKRACRVGGASPSHKGFGVAPRDLPYQRPPFSAMDVALLMHLHPTLAHELLQDLEAMLMIPKKPHLADARNGHHEDTVVMLEEGGTLAEERTQDPYPRPFQHMRALKHASMRRQFLPAVLSLSSWEKEADPLLSTAPLLAICEAKLDALWPLWVLETSSYVTLCVMYTLFTAGGYDWAAWPCVGLAGYAGLVELIQLVVAACMPLFGNPSQRTTQIYHYFSDPCIHVVAPTLE